MIDLLTDFQEHVAEVDAFLELIKVIEYATHDGVPLIQRRAATARGFVIDPLQQKLLYANVYLHLYNLVEATISNCIAAVERATASGWKASDISPHLQKEWVKAIARTHETLDSEKRQEAALKLCQHLIGMLPVEMKISRGGGGNWDDEEIFRLAQRIGVNLSISEKAIRDIKQPFRDGRGALQLVKYLRNQLAHGKISFAECGEGLDAAHLVDLKDRTVRYLGEVINCFQQFIQQHEYLHPQKRPAAGAA